MPEIDLLAILDNEKRGDDLKSMVVFLFDVFIQHVKESRAKDRPNFLNATALDAIAADLDDWKCEGADWRRKANMWMLLMEVRERRRTSCSA